MMPFPPPPLDPFDRLQITDGLVINAARWQQAHAYHQRRQSVVYQSLHQPGVVCGLGVQIIEAPPTIHSQYRDRRWVEVQPGLAIDLVGNPIVVTEPMPYRIATTATSEPVTVYLVVSYVDPDSLLPRQQETVREIFRLDERLSPPEPHEVEVCRLQIYPGEVVLAQSDNPFSPGENQIDVRHRRQAKARSPVIQVAHLVSRDPASGAEASHLQDLLAATPALYPALDAVPTLDSLDLDSLDAADVAAYDAFYLSGRQALSLSSAALQALKTALDRGAVLLAEPQRDGVEFAKSIVAIAKQVETPLQPFDKLPLRHPLRTQPFWFPTLPTIHQQPVFLLSGGGIVLMNNLSLGWGMTPELALSRDAIRTAQELGINILQFAHQRRRLMGLTAGSEAAIASDRPQAVSQSSQSPGPKPTSEQLLDQLID